MEIVGIPGSDLQTPGFGDCGNQPVKPLQAPSRALASNDKIAISVGRRRIEIEDAVRKASRCKVVELPFKLVTAPAKRQTG